MSNIKPLYSRDSRVYDGAEVCEVSVICNSMHGLTGSTPYLFSCKLDKIAMFDEIYLSYLGFPTTVYNAGSAVNGDSWILDEQGFPPVTLKLPQSFYTATNFPGDLQTFLNANSPGGLVYTVTLDPNTGRLTISTTSNFRFGDGTTGVNILNDFYYSIGYNDVTGNIVVPYALSHTPNGTINLAPIRDALFVEISVLRNKGISNSNCSYTFIVPEGSISRQIGTYSSGSGFRQLVKGDMNQSVSEFTVSITDSRGRYIMASGGNTVLVLSFTPRRINHWPAGSGSVGAYGQQGWDGGLRYLA
jgi:hypothetical protein